MGDIGLNIDWEKEEKSIFFSQFTANISREPLVKRKIFQARLCKAH